MAEHLTSLDIKKLLKLIDAWDSSVKFSWNALREMAIKNYGITACRKTLSEKVEIYEAYSAKKKQAKSTVATESSRVASLKIAQTKIAKLEAENRRLQSENDRLTALFKVWQYNAYTYGMKESQLYSPIPAKRKTANVE